MILSEFCLLDFIFWLSDFDKGYIFFYSQLSSSCQVYAHISVYLQFFTRVSVLYKRLFWQNDIFQFCSAVDLQPCFVSHFRPYQTSVNAGQHTVLLFWPLAFFQLKRLAVQSGSCSLLKRPVVGFYRLYMQNGCGSISLIPCWTDLLCSRVNADLRRLYLWGSLKGHFNSHESKGRFLCRCRCV